MSSLTASSDVSSAANRVAARFMLAKGYIDEPIGVYVDGSYLSFYYRLPEGLLELQVQPLPGDNRWKRHVTDFITDRAELAEMLGDESPSTPVDVGTALFSSASD